MVGFQEKDRQDSQDAKNGTFCRLSVVWAQSIIESEKYPDAAMLTSFVHDESSLVYG